jgi:hypothetical protein
MVVMQVIMVELVDLVAVVIVVVGQCQLLVRDLLEAPVVVEDLPVEAAVELEPWELLVTLMVGRMVELV